MKVEQINEPIAADSIVGVDNGFQRIERDPDAPVMFLCLEDGGEAMFRMPYVADLKAAEKIEGAIAYQGQQPVFTVTYYRAILRQICIDWNGDPAMPPSEKIDGIDDQEMIEMLNAYQMKLNEAVDQFVDTKGKEIEVSLTTGDVLTFVRLSQADRENLEKKIQQLDDPRKQLADSNILSAIAVAKRWNLEPINEGGLWSFFDSLDLENYTRIVQATDRLFRKSSSKKSFRFS